MLTNKFAVVLLFVYCATFQHVTNKQLPNDNLSVKPVGIEHRQDQLITVFATVLLSGFT